jgi:hypothetical protein
LAIANYNFITFPTIIRNFSTAIVNIFLDISKHDNYKVQTLQNGLLDHEAQLLTTDIALGHLKFYQTVIQRQINKCTIADFQLQLSYESWDTVLEGNDVNQIFLTRF